MSKYKYKWVFCQRCGKAIYRNTVKYKSAKVMCRNCQLIPSDEWEKRLKELEERAEREEDLFD